MLTVDQFMLEGVATEAHPVGINVKLLNYHIYLLGNLQAQSSNHYTLGFLYSLLQN
jgi:hypothetical protein